MKIIPPYSTDFIAIIARPDSLLCCWLVKITDIFFEIKGYEYTPLSSLELEQLIIFNPTKIKQLITHFINKNNLSFPVAAFALTGPMIKEKIIAADEEPQLKEFNLENESQWVLQNSYLYTNDHNKHIYYSCATKRELIFMYHLLALQISCNLTMITTERMSLFSLYQALYGTAFRREQFGTDLIKHNHIIEELFSTETACRSISSKIPPTMRMALLPACGLYTIHESEFNYENK